MLGLKGTTLGDYGFLSEFTMLTTKLNKALNIFYHDLTPPRTFLRLMKQKRCYLFKRTIFNYKILESKIIQYCELDLVLFNIYNILTYIHFYLNV